MSRRAILWVAFALVHVGVATLGFVLPNQPMGDVYLVYEPWSNRALDGAGIVGITEGWVYPQLALVPMVLAHGLSWIGGYTIGWVLLVTLCDALAFGLLVGRARSRGRCVAAWFWLASIALLGPIALYRIDAITVPLAIAGCLWLVGRPWLGSILLAVATWIKVWPAALLAAAVIAVRRRLAVVGGAIVVSTLTLGAVAAAGGLRYAFGFIGDQTGRGLQLEAPISTLYLWRAVARIDGSFIYYDPDMLTFQVTGPNVDVVVALMTPLLVLAVGAVAVLGAMKARRGASFAVLFPPLALALVTGFIAFNKVGSPQYLTWIVVPLVTGLVLDRRRWRSPAALALLIAALTQLVYPLTYSGLLAAQPLPAALLTARNLLVVVLFVWAVVRLARVPVRSASGVAAARDASLRAARSRPASRSVR
ncbi:glycosyltransferase 87 family protein [Microbacterium luticocti]|uniref:glycosyltransferase 87 family protein n=1 Tax=Microbacterium luticocti TaxID=451764 RepID=UPI00048D0C59|nr:glycosyltransferase 87 family protein [Microbacterium luticocti]